MLVLQLVLSPSTTIYYVEDNHFSSVKEDAYKFDTREEALEVQNKFSDIENLEIVNA